VHPIAKLAVISRRSPLSPILPISAHFSHK
jgi:hypothetical protein